MDKNKEEKTNQTNRIPHKVPTVEEADAAIAAIMKQHPHLSYYDAIMLNVYRWTQGHSMIVSNSSGGGSYRAFCRKIGVDF